jgi:Glycosyl transferases group 1
VSIVVISPFDPIPGESLRPGRFTHLCEALEELNESAIWLTSDFSHISKKKRELDATTALSYKIILVRTLPYRTNISLLRLLSHFLFGVSVVFWLFKIKHAQNIKGIICSNPPITVNFLVAIFCKLFKIPGICDINDVWPEAYSRFLLNPLIIKTVFPALKYIRRISFRGFSAITAVSEDYLKIISNDIPVDLPTQNFPLSHDFDEFNRQIDTEWNMYTKDSTQIWAIYVGTISKNYDLKTIIDSANLFPNVIFFFAGTGEDFDYFTQYVAKLETKNVIFTGFLSYKNLCNLLNLCDIGLLSVNNNAFIRFPNKTFDYFAAGLTVLSNISEGEVSDFLKSENIGETFIEGNLISFQVTLSKLIANRKLKSKAIAKIAKSKYHSKLVYRNFAYWTKQVIESKNGNNA